MSNNAQSDSQESDILPEEDYKFLKSDIGAIPAYWFQSFENKMDEHFDLTRKNEEEEEVNVKKEEEFPQEANSNIPVKDEFAGLYNFQVLLSNQDTSKNWVYSSALKKVFINMEEPLPLRFRWEPPEDGFSLRTTMVFALDQYASDPVRRCHNHMAPNNPSNRDIDPRVIKHVVRCLHHLSMYEERNEHLSIVTPLSRPQPGSQYVPVCFKFLCKNSCPSGMNRRPTELIFTLEDSNKTVLGRRRLPVRICSCPKRDKKKEEAELEVTPPETKKCKGCCTNFTKKMMPCDTNVFNVQFRMVGKENYIRTLRYAYDTMAGQAVRTGQFHIFKPYLDELSQKLP